MKTKEFIVKITIDDAGHCQYEIRDYNSEQTEFIPPLQAELEMLKQRAGLTSAYDDQMGNQNGNTCSGFLDQ